MDTRRFSIWNLLGAVSLGLLVYAGQLQATLLSWIPVDLTLLCCALLVCSFVGTLIQNRKPISVWLLIPIFLWVLFFLNAAWSPSTAYATEKQMLLFSLTLLLAISPFLVLRYSAQRVAFLLTLTFTGLVWGIVTLASPETANGVQTVAEINTIGAARISGTGALILLVVGLTASRKLVRISALAVGSFLLLAIIATGSRGPLLAVATGIAAVVFVSPALRGKRTFGAVLLVLTACVAFWWSNSRDLSDRAFAWIAGERDSSTATREYLWQEALDGISRTPLGSGWGSFAQRPYMLDSLGYPHNIVLEIFYEAGWFIGALFLIFVVCSLVRLAKTASNPVGAGILALAICSLVNALVSGDINNNRLLWIGLSCAWLLPLASCSEKQTDVVYGVQPSRLLADRHELRKAALDTSRR